MLLSSLALTHAFVIPDDNQAFLGNNVQSDKYLVELGPGETRWISEEDKWSLKRVCVFLIAQWHSTGGTN